MVDGSVVTSTMSIVEVARVAMAPVNTINQNNAECFTKINKIKTLEFDNIFFFYDPTSQPRSQTHIYARTHQEVANAICTHTHTQSNEPTLLLSRLVSAAWRSMLLRVHDKKRIPYAPDRIKRKSQLLLLSSLVFIYLFLFRCAAALSMPCSRCENCVCAGCEDFNLI